MALLALAAGLAGCGQGGGGKAPTLGRLPLVSGATVVVQHRQCDRGANAFCALELVVVDPRYRSSDQLLTAEHIRVHAAGWDGVTGDTVYERAAVSRGQKLRVTYATASGDLTGIDLGKIERSREIALALSRAMFDHSSAISVELETGTS